MKKITLVFYVFMCFFSINILHVHAGTLGDARVDVTLAGDDATLVWTLPCTKDAANKSVLTYSIKETGQTGVDIDYVSATANGDGPFMLESNSGEQNATIFCGKGGTKATFTYTTKSKVKGAGVVIEFPVFYNTDTFDSVDVFVKLPYDKMLLSASFPYKIIDGSAVFHFQDIREADIYESKNVLLSFIKSPLPRGYEYKKIGPYNIYGQSRSVRVLEKIEPYINELAPFYKKTFGLNVESGSINVFVTDLSLINTEYQAGALALTKENLILIDSENLAQLETVDLVKLLVHETTHMIVGTSGIFSNQPVAVQWLDEGIAVFGEEYFVDNYFNKDSESKIKSEVVSGYQKFSTTTLQKEYEREFDFYFSEPKSIQDTYSHAGLVFYKAFIDDPAIIKNLIIQLRNEIVYEYCESCAPEKAKLLFISLTGRSEVDTFYPFKNEVVIPDKYSILFRSALDEAATQKIKNKAARETTSYFASSTRSIPERVVVREKVEVDQMKQPISTTTPVVTSGYATSTASSTPYENVTKHEIKISSYKMSVFEQVFFAPARLIEYLLKLKSS